MTQDGVQYRKADGIHRGEFVMPFSFWILRNVHTALRNLTAAA